MNENIKIISAEAISPAPLLDFYHQMYPERDHMLPRLWPWINRTSFPGNKAPLLLLDQNQIIGHAGRIPLHLYFEGQTYLAAWFTDFSLLPQRQGQGLGTHLARHWMEFPQIGVTMANDKSMGVFHKLGWSESPGTFLHYFLLKPFHHPKFVSAIPAMLQKILNPLAWPLLKSFYLKAAQPLEDLAFQPVEARSLSDFKALTPSCKRGCEPLRNKEYVDWRLLQSPELSKYSVVKLKNNGALKAVIKRRDDKPLSRHIDILWLSDPAPSETLLRLVSTLALWSFENDFAYCRLYTTNPDISRCLKKLSPIIRHPRFGFFTKDAKLMSKLSTALWHYELIDSDFEFF